MDLKFSEPSLLSHSTLLFAPQTVYHCFAECRMLHPISVTLLLTRTKQSIDGSSLLHDDYSLLNVCLPSLVRHWTYLPDMNFSNVSFRKIFRHNHDYWWNKDSIPRCWTVTWVKIESCLLFNERKNMWSMRKVIYEPKTSMPLGLSRTFDCMSSANARSLNREFGGIDKRTGDPFSGRFS